MPSWAGKTPGGGSGSLLQCSCLENPADRGSLAGYRTVGSQRDGHDFLAATETALTALNKFPPNTLCSSEPRMSWCPHYRAP